VAQAWKNSSSWSLCTPAEQLIIYAKVFQRQLTFPCVAQYIRHNYREYFSRDLYTTLHIIGTDLQVRGRTSSPILSPPSRILWVRSRVVKFWFWSIYDPLPNKSWLGFNTLSALRRLRWIPRICYEQIAIITILKLHLIVIPPLCRKAKTHNLSDRNVTLHLKSDFLFLHDFKISFTHPLFVLQSCCRNFSCRLDKYRKFYIIRFYQWATWYFCCSRA